MAGKKMDKYAICTPEDWEKYLDSGEEDKVKWLSPQDTENLRSGDTIVICWTGGSKEIVIA